MENKNIDKIQEQEITEEMKSSYLDYAMSVIISRALPDVRDGLKPVQRRILYVMLEDGLRYSARFRKSANVVGLTLARYHPHGDSAVYDALARMAQDFSLRYPLVKGQGNFGCFTKDTKVKLCDGRDLSFEGLIKEQKKGKKHWTFTFNHQDKKIEVAEIKNPRLTRKNEKIIETTLDNGEKIRSTLDHLFMIRDGSYKEAKDLKTGDSLMPLYKGFYDGQDKNFKKYPTIFQPFQNNWEFVHHLADKWNLENNVYKKSAGRSHVLAESQKYNHKVVKTRILKKREDVYDLTIDRWHNFSLSAGVFVHNSIDNDPPAAARYTEAKLSKIGETMLKDIEKNTVDFIDNYDGTRKEPMVLPSPVPQLLLNGTLGIAVGMATNIPPHNASEVLDALIYLISNSQADTVDLFEFIKGPDFPTGGEIFDQEGIIQAYSQGKGPILMRAKAEITERKQDQFKIVITEIPFQVSKSNLLEQMANLVTKKKIKGIKNIRDESDKEGLRIVVELQSGSFPQKILNQLYKFTDLQKTFHLNTIVLVDGIQPKLLSLVELLNYFIIHRREVITRRVKYDLEKTKERNHILEGLAKCLDRIDEVIKIIKGSADRQEAHKKLQKRFKLTSIQTDAILDTRLASLVKLERGQIEEELRATRTKIKELTEILKSPKKINTLIKEGFKELKKEFGDKRRTKAHVQKVEKFSVKDLVPHEETIITLTKGGYIKRIKPETYKAQKRGGKGVLGIKTVGEDLVEHLLAADTHDSLLFFTDWGKVFRTFVYEIPLSERTSKGKGILNFLEMSSQERVLSVLSFNGEEDHLKTKYLLMATKNGIIKKVPIDKFKEVRKNGLIAISLQKGDELKAARKTSEEDEVILTTKKGIAIKFKEKDLRPMGRQAKGIKGIRLKKDDEIIGMDVIPKHKIKEAKHYLLVLAENGYGKRTAISSYRLQKRAGSGIKTAKITKKTGELIFSKVVEKEEDLIVSSCRGHIIRVKIDSIPIIGRTTQGVKIMRLDKDDRVASAVCL